jgi:hypothetical protein
MNLKFKNLTPFAFLIFVFLIAPITTFAQVGSLRIIVGGRELPASARAEQRGSQTLLPVAAIARELGYEVNINAQTETIKVRRPNAEAEFIKQLGEVRENGVTLTAVAFTAEIVFTADVNSLLLPAEAASALLNVSLIIDKQKNVVLINSRDEKSETVSAAGSKYEVGDLNYNYNLNFSNGSFYQNLNINSTGRIGDDTYQLNTNLIGGGNYRFINFSTANFTLQRANGDQFQAGDLSTSLGSEMSLLNTLVRGASFTRPIFDDRGKFSVYGGRSYSGVLEQIGENLVARRSPAIPFNTTIVGSRMTFEPYRIKPNTIQTKNLSFSTGAVWFNGANNKGILFDGTARYNTKHFRLETELAVGSFDSETADHRKIKGFGTGMILNGSYQPWDFLTLQGRYERYSPNFSNPSRTNQYNNRETKSASINIQPLKNLTLGANASINNNKNPILLNRSLSDGYRSETYGLNFGYDPGVKFLPRLSVNASKLKSPLFGDLTFVNANLAREFKSFRPFVNYIMTEGNGNTNHSINLGTSIDAGKLGQFQGQYSFSLSKTPFLREEEIRCQIEPQECPLTFTPKLGISNKNSSVDWNPNKLFFNFLRFTVGTGFIQNAEKTSLQFRGSASIALPSKQNLQISYYRTGYGTDLRFSITGPLAFWKAKNRLSETLSNEALLTESNLRGRVYLDENGNRQFDAGIDIGVGNVRVRLNNGREVVSDTNGSYDFDRVLPGDNHLAVNIEDIRANLVSANGLEQTVAVSPRTVVNTAFRLVKSGSLSGRIWHDANSNDQYDENEGLPDIHILSSTGRDTYTDADGTFLLSELPPGEQSIFIDKRYQPENLTTANLSVQVEVSSGAETKNIEFIFKTKPREVKEINFGAKSSLASTPLAPGTTNK